MLWLCYQWTNVLYSSVFIKHPTWNNMAPDRMLCNKLVMGNRPVSVCETVCRLKLFNIVWVQSKFGTRETVLMWYWGFWKHTHILTVGKYKICVFKRPMAHYLSPNKRQIRIERKWTDFKRNAIMHRLVCEIMCIQGCWYFQLTSVLNYTVFLPYIHLPKYASVLLSSNITPETGNENLWKVLARQRDGLWANRIATLVS